MHKAPVLTRSEELVTAELTNGGSGPIWDALVNNVQCGSRALSVNEQRHQHQHA